MVPRRCELHLHPGDDVGDAPDWTDFTFDANDSAPVSNHCHAGDCIRVEDGVVHIPRGFTILLEERITPQDTCAANACSAYDGAFETAADALVSSVALLSNNGVLDPRDPLGLGPCGPSACFDPVGTAERALRQQNGAVLSNTGPLNILPRATWQTASTSSDSRLEIRLA